METRRDFLRQTAALGLAAAVAPPTLARTVTKTYRMPQTDLVVSRIAYGCDKLGWKTELNAASYASSLMRSFNEPLSAQELSDAERVVHTAYDNGITLFDLADFYGGGKSESAFGAVLKKSPGMRERIIVQTKCGNRLAQGFDLSGEHLVRSVEGSLKRLGTDRLDVLLLHVPDALAEPGEVARAFDELHRTGKVRYFGVSNQTIGQLELLRKFVRQPIVCCQVQIGLAQSAAIIGFPFNDARYTGLPTIVDYCRLHDIQVQAYAPLKGSDVLSAPNLLDPPADASAELKNAAQVLKAMAAKKNTTPSAVAIAWLLRHPAGIVPIIGATRPEHITENCAADGVELTRVEWYSLLQAGAAIQRAVRAQVSSGTG